jgi:ABC-type branched-subunit amino acid transport system ATPase component
VTGPQIVGVIGPNGAGKSTLLKTVFGYLRPFSGTVAFAGRDLVGLRPDEILRHGIAFVAQAGGLFSDMTVAENLALGGYSLASRAQARATLEAVYEQFSLFRERRRQVAGSLSGGEQRILAIARALIAQPRLILLDEPSAALAPASSGGCAR